MVIRGEGVLFKMTDGVHFSGRTVVRIPIECIQPNPDQPRRQFALEELSALADSMGRHGQLAPILVRPLSGNRYALIAGERRLRALKMLGRSFAEALVIPREDRECALMALVENLERSPLHFLDEAEACRKILDKYAISQERLAASLSRSPSALANRLRLLKLAPSVRDVVRERGLTERHARALLKVDDPAWQLHLARRAADEHMSVKALEKCVQTCLGSSAKSRRTLTPLIRDNRIVINALMDTVRELGRIGVPVKSRIEERENHVEVIVCIPACGSSPVEREKGDGEGI